MKKVSILFSMLSILCCIFLIGCRKEIIEEIENKGICENQLDNRNSIMKDYECIFINNHCVSPLHNWSIPKNELIFYEIYDSEEINNFDIFEKCILDENKQCINEHHKGIKFHNMEYIIYLNENE
ncbi:MAG: hypothetical protein NC182_00200 [Prevotella sp.]|nr:hypothetical protein [Staphylococcus sp.]MCM1349604.1 hypothetical protein [Prevotella sp.]